MTVTGSYDSFRNSWPPPTSHTYPILYTVTPSGMVDRIYPQAGQPYEWVVDSGGPSESDFLAVYGYAHKVTRVAL